ncbi:MAG: hypothetical protein R2710_22870 [Acidimicrobiales bacterium]
MGDDELGHAEAGSEVPPRHRALPYEGRRRLQWAQEQERTCRKSCSEQHHEALAVAVARPPHERRNGAAKQPGH